LKQLGFYIGFWFLLACGWRIKLKRQGMLLAYVSATQRKPNGGQVNALQLF
jgi:hypothetical protein